MALNRWTELNVHPFVWYQDLRCFTTLCKTKKITNDNTPTMSKFGPSGSGMVRKISRDRAKDTMMSGKVFITLHDILTQS